MRIILMFLYIFAFDIPYINDSSKIVGIILISQYLFIRNYRSKVNQLLMKKTIYGIYISWALVVFWFLLTQIIHSTYQFDFLITFINLLIQIVIGIFLYAKYEVKGINNKIIRDIILCFILQTVIQWLSFVSVEIREYLNIFRSEDAILIGQKYNNMRALAISGSQFFGLSASFGLIYMIYLSKIKELQINNKLLSWALFLFLISGTFFAGRTGYIGLLLGTLYLIIVFLFKKEGKFQKANKSFKNLLVTSGISLLMLIFLRIIWARVDLTNFTYLIRYTFEFLINKINNGTFSTTSTDGLFQNMYFLVGTKTFLIGDGKYFDYLTNSYYMKTDAGYMRNILLFGLIGILLLILFQFMIIRTKSRKLNLFDVLCVTYIFILHIKGEVLGFLIMFQSILLLLYLSESTAKKN